MNCFVVMPFGNPRTESEKARRFAHIYTHWIKAAVEELVIGPDLPRIQCHRGDSDHRPGEVMAQVIRALSEADFVIADLTGQNCNVFYELGVRHALRNNAILIAQDIEDIPFDLRGQRAIPYRYEEPESLIALKSRLQNSLKDMLSSPTSIDNPVQRCLSDREFAKLGSSPDHAVRQLADQVKVLREELAVRVTEILTLVQNTTSRPQEASQATPGSIGVLAGAWTTLEHGGLYVFRLVGSELRGPYCYGSEMNSQRISSIFKSSASRFSVGFDGSRGISRAARSLRW